VIHRTEQDAVALLEIEHGKVNALDLELCREITTALDAEADTASRAVVLTGRGKCLSAGVDLHRLLGGGAEYVREFVPALGACFERLAFCPKPLVVAANGHAIAGGCVLLQSADWRVVADGKARIGVTELPVGVPFPGLAFEILRAAVPAHHLREVIYRGKTYAVDRALEMGLCDEVCPPDELLERARTVARELGAIPPQTFHIANRQVTDPIREAAARHADVTEQWTSPEVQSAIQRFVERTIR
jgi:enoyl-CoA hydratase